ncbi:hypothetical protein J22TS1_43460 [Siminovitchia terrae]|uniref:hypothetical protein n=1 Tax=Siminovitchia terrae TaxID=1914933 RepID=UPI001B1B4AD2|nr:hypothetical protein [Siminovitchia terrae]GIN93295.1 hypothetical protein J22TS1_43460 [Siminovitchia terrae]
MPCSSSTVIQLCTDASTYSAKATSIDVESTYGGGTPLKAPGVEYSVRCEVWDKSKSKWVERGTRVYGTFYTRSATKKFPISSLGLKKGSNSVRVIGNYTRTDNFNGTIYSSAQPAAFIVKR